jgi:hypothetical protein
MNIEPKNIIYIISPFVLIGIAWGTSTATINDLKKEQELIKAKVDKVQVMWYRCMCGGKIRCNWYWFI